MLSNNTRIARLSRNSLLIILHRAIKMLDSTIIAHPQARAHVLQHGHIVADHQDTTLELAQRRAESVHGFDIQVIGRFVQDEDVRVLQADTRKCHAGFLASG